jgi:hypothetical protein
MMLTSTSVRVLGQGRCCMGCRILIFADAINQSIECGIVEVADRVNLLLLHCDSTTSKCNQQSTNI